MNQRRRGESEGRKLTPGERAVNWAKALVIIVPLFGTGWLANEGKQIYAEANNPPIDTPVAEIVPTPQENEKTCPNVDLTPVLKAIESFNCNLPEGHNKLHGQ